MTNRIRVDITLNGDQEFVVVDRWKIREGERVDAGDVLCVVAFGEPLQQRSIRSPHTGFIDQIIIQETEGLNKGAVLAVLNISNKKKAYDTSPIIKTIEELQTQKKSTTCPLKNDEIDGQIRDQRILLLNLFKELKKKEQARFGIEHKEFVITTGMLEEYCKYVPVVPVDPRACVEPLVKLIHASKVEDLESCHSLLPFIYAQSTSTYPYMEYKGNREGEPVCDQYRMIITPNDSIIALADGCNWGKAPAIAARKACKAFADYMHRKRDLFFNTHRIAKLCLEGLAAAHNSIISGPYPEGTRIGTTTLLGGVLTKLILPDSKDKPIGDVDDWAFVFASIGDCKAYLWNSRAKRIDELTPDSRGENFLDASDCGGRIGPYIEGGPDLRNLEIFMSPCVTGDIFFVCSDGVHDNFDPQMHGLHPKDIGLEKELWTDCTPSEANAAKAIWRVAEMKRVAESNRPSVDDLTKKFIDYCVTMNAPAQAFMQEFLGKRLPNDYLKFPGKMDHTTMITVRVGEIPLSKFGDTPFSYSPFPVSRTKSGSSPIKARRKDRMLRRKSATRRNHSLANAMEEGNDSGGSSKMKEFLIALQSVDTTLEELFVFLNDADNDTSGLRKYIMQLKKRSKAVLLYVDYDENASNSYRHALAGVVSVLKEAGEKGKEETIKAFEVAHLNLSVELKYTKSTTTKRMMMT